jgi:hemolysin activation/secretion protein
VAPENLDDAKVFSAFYLARFESLPTTSLLLQGVKQDSNISTLGGAAVAGRGYVLGARGLFTLPPGKSYFHSLSLGLDFKHFDEDVVFGGQESKTPIDYYPASLNYSGSYVGKNSATDVNAGVTWHFRGMGADPIEFDAKRYNATGSFFYFRGDVGHTQDLPWGLQAYAKVQGQWANQPLINSEQFSGGGLGTARGYLESAALGDNAIFGTFELRSPSFLPKKIEVGTDKKVLDKGNEWRLHAFVDGGRLTVNDPLPEQEEVIDLVSWGVGTRFRIFNHLNGSLDAGFPLKTRGADGNADWMFTFRGWTDF